MGNLKGRRNREKVMTRSRTRRGHHQLDDAKERRNSGINGSRRKAIAKGSGRREEVNRLLKQFVQMKKS